MEKQTESNLKEQIKTLVKLQALDSQIYKLSSEEKKIPEELNLLKKEYKEKEEKARETKEEIKNKQLEIKKMEGDLKSKEDKIKKHQAQLYQVKTNKEYTSLEEEIKNQKSDISLLEEKIINLLDEVEQMRVALFQKKEGLQKDWQLLCKKEEVWNKRKEEIRKQIKELNQRKENFSSIIDHSIIKQYNRILKKKGEKAMSAVKNDACQECCLTLTAQIIEEIKMSKELIICSNCSRILYME